MISRILVIGTTLASACLVRSLASANTGACFTYMTVHENSVDLPNVEMKIIHLNYVHNNRTGQDEFRVPIGWVADHVERTQSSYDLVLVLNYEFQRSPQFSDMCRRVSVPVLCPDTGSSRLENDKLFAKSLLLDCGIPTPAWSTIDAAQAVESLDALELPIVFKMCHHTGFLGYGSWVFKDRSYREIVPRLIAAQESDQVYYVEEHIEGAEVSAHFLCNGSDCIYMGSARDYKRMHDGDRGHNTAGVGAYSPVGYFTDHHKSQLFAHMDRLMRHLTDVGIHFCGFLYVGLIIDENDKLHVLELNTRPGSPELLTILPGLDQANLLDNLHRAALRKAMVPLVGVDSLPAVAVCLFHRSYGPKRKWYSSQPKLDLPDDVETIRSSLVLGGFNYHGALVATGSTVLDASVRIYTALASGQDLGDYTHRHDIGRLV